jgi:uncharacterized protein YaaW (UPF0174 family)
MHEIDWKQPLMNQDNPKALATGRTAKAVSSLRKNLGARHETTPLDRAKQGSLTAVLELATHAELDCIVEALDRSWDSLVKAESLYQSYKDDWTRCPFYVEHHLLRAGGNSFRNIVRDGGPPYPEVLRDVCRVVKVDVADTDDVTAMEENFLRDIVERAWHDMTPEQREEIARAAKDELGLAEDQLSSLGSMSWTLPFSMIAAQLGTRLAGFIVYKVAVQVANIAARQVFGQGLRLAANAALTRAIGVALGPIGWIASIGWLAIDIAGPSYKGLAPAVFYVAVIRQRLLWQEVQDV